MIPQDIIDDFLFNRPLKNYRTYKELTGEQLEEKWCRLPITPPIWDQLRLDQKQCFIAGAETGSFQYFNDTGMGKTLLSIALIRYFWALEQLDTALVLVPNEINLWEWEDEILKHSPTTKYVILNGSSAEKWAQLDANPKAAIAVTTYNGLMWMVCKEVPNKKKKNKKDLIPDQSKLNRLRKRIRGLVLDESTKVATRGTVPFRVCRQVAKACSMVFGLTGTPFSRNLEMLWAQMFLIDGGETLGKSLGMFRACFFKEEENRFSGWPDFIPDHTRTPILRRTLYNRSLRYKAKEGDLPRLTHIPKYARLPGDASDYYKKAHERLVAAYHTGNWTESSNSFLRARQISSGFLGFKDDEAGEKATFEFEHNPKLDLLLSIIDSIDEEAKFLIMHDFVFSGELITKALRQAKIKHVHLNRKTDKEKIKRQFNEDPTVRAFVFNTAGSYGLNLQIAQYGIFYERPVSPIDQYQMIHRFERQYSKHDAVFLYDCIAKDTVDQSIIDYYEDWLKDIEAVLDADDERSEKLLRPQSKQKTNRDFLHYVVEKA